MKKCFLRIGAFFCAIVLLFSANACSDSKRLTVTIPTGRVRISPGEIDAEAFYLVNWVGRSDRYHVSLECGELFIRDAVGFSLPNSYFARAGESYFLGVNCGEFDGWVAYVPFDRDYHDKEPQLILQENCCGFYEVDNMNLLLFTGLSHMDTNYGRVYHIKRVGNETYGVEDWSCLELAELNGKPLVYLPCEDERILYIATNNGLHALHEDGSLQTFAVPDEWDEMHPNSIVLKDGVLYFGMHLGILAYYPETETYDWYPLDFAREDK